MLGGRVWCCAAVLLGSVWAARAQPVVYVLLPEFSFVTFEVLHFGTSTIRGRFGPLQGEVVLDRKGGRGEVNMRVATRAVDTGVGVFNARLRQADLLGSDAHPEAYFVARTMRFQGDALVEVRGEFTFRGISQPLSLHAQRFSCRAAEPTGGTVLAAGTTATAGRASEICGGDFVGDLLRSDFGATFGLPLVGDRVRLLVQAEGRLQP